VTTALARIGLRNFSSAKGVGELSSGQVFTVLFNLK
jgi:hypothetical protein